MPGTLRSNWIVSVLWLGHTGPGIHSKDFHLYDKPVPLEELKEQRDKIWLSIILKVLLDRMRQVDFSKHELKPGDEMQSCWDQPQGGDVPETRNSWVDESKQSPFCWSDIVSVVRLVYLSIHLSIHLSNCPSIHLSVCLSIYPSNLYAYLA